MPARSCLLALAIALGLSLALSVPAAAGGSFALTEVSVRTRDGLAWSEGAPIVLVVRVTSPSGLAFPDRALSVVMQTDGERTKCLDVAMKRVSADDGTATYAGVFYPFRAATYDGRFAIGDDLSDIRFAVSTAAPVLASVPNDAELPVLGPVRLDHGPDARGIGALGALAALVLAGAVLVGRRRRGLASA